MFTGTHLEISTDEQKVDLETLLSLSSRDRSIDRVQLAVAASFDGDLCKSVWRYDQIMRLKT